MVDEYMTWDSEKEWLRMMADTSKNPKMADAVEELIFTKENYDEKKRFYIKLFTYIWGYLNRYCGAV